MEFLSEMLDRGIQPDVVTYSSIVHGFCNLGQLNEATRLFKEMVEPNVYTYNALMDGYCLRREMNEAKKVFEIMVRKGCGPDVHSYNILINGYCKSRRMEEAKSLLAEMSHKALLLILSVTYSTLMQDLTTYSILLDGFCKHGHLDEALKLLKAMQEKKLEPNIVLYNILIEDVVTYNSIVHGFCNLGQLNEATRLFKEMASRDVMPNTVTFTILVDGLCKEGMVSEARRVFETMTEKVVRALIDPDGALRDIRDLDSISFSDWFLSKGGTRMSIQRMWDPTEASLLRMLKGSPDVYLSGPIRKYIEDKGGRQILYDRSPDGEILVTGLATSKMEGNGVCKVMAGSRLVHQTSEKSDCATDKKVVKADAYVVDADFSCFADLALTSPEDYYIEGQGSLLQCVLTPGDPYMSLTNDKIIERVSKQALVTSEFKMFGLTEHLSLRLPSFLLTFCMGAHMVLALFPSSQGLEVIWSSVVKIAQSLYREGPGKDPFRPDQKTLKFRLVSAYDGLYNVEVTYDGSFLLPKVSLLEQGR
uniref:Uncharacterized protein n=1 Tax=Salix viminalis TaxID=40686 RepID=A0A6N2LXZ1_SALVM